MMNGLLLTLYRINNGFMPHVDMLNTKLHLGEK